MAGLSRKEIHRIVEHVQPQGVSITRTKKGLLMRMPDDKTAMVHWTTSDHRAGDNLRATLKRSGVTWPFDGDSGLPKSITEAKPTTRVLERTRKALEDAGNPPRLHIREAERIIYAEKDEAGAVGRNLQVARQLYGLGWRPEPGKKSNRVWMRPLELEPEPAWLTPVEAIEPEPEPEPIVEPEPEPTWTVPGVEPEPAPREFIDTAESWTVELESLPAGITLEYALQLLGAAGLHAELRVWRRV